MYRCIFQFFLMACVFSCRKIRKSCVLLCCSCTSSCTNLLFLLLTLNCTEVRNSPIQNVVALKSHYRCLVWMNGKSMEQLEPRFIPLIYWAKTLKDISSKKRSSLMNWEWGWHLAESVHKIFGPATEYDPDTVSNPNKSKEAWRNYNCPSEQMSW